MAGTAADPNTTPRPISPISPTSALKLLLDSNPSIHAAAARLTTAIYTNECRLWCNDNLVPPRYIVTSLVVVAGTEADGRPRADVVSSVREAWVQQIYKFEFDADEVCALLPTLNCDGLASPPSKELESKQRGPKAVKKTKRQPQSDRARWALRRMFSDGRIPAELSTSTLERNIIDELKSEAGKNAKMDSVPFPSWDVVDDVRHEPLFP